MLDLFNTAQQDTSDTLARNAQAAPKVGVMPTFGEAYSAAREENARYDDLFAQGRNEYDYVQQHLEHYAGQTGETLPNPMTPRAAGSPAASLAFVRQKFIDKARTMDDPSLTFPSDDEIRAGGINLGRQARQRAAELAQGPSGPGALAGDMVAGLVSSTTDPLNGISLALAPEGGPLLMAALKVGGGFALQQAATEAATYGYQQAINPEHGVGEAIGSVFEAAGSGFLQEAGLRGLGMGWRKLRGAKPELAAAMPLEVRDAGAVAEKAEDLSAQNPFKGVSGEAAHHEAIAKVESDLLSGNRVELPRAAEQEAGAKRGQVFYPGGSISARYELAELSDLVTSHDRDFNINPAYPAELQPRDRAGAPARDQVQSIYSNLEPERLGPSPEANAGAPLVGPDGVVESGNGRVLALGKAYGARPVEEYDRARILSEFTKPDGTVDTTGANEALIQRTKAALDEGGSAAMVVEGKPREIVSVNRLGLVDKDGNAWGTAPLLMPRPGNRDFLQIRPAASGDAGARYRAWLESQGHDTSGYRQPVLVGVRETSMSAEERANFAHAANGSAALRLNAVEQALSDARNLSSDVLDLLKSRDINAAGNRDFARAFVAKLPQGERGGMLTRDGSLSAGGQRRIQAAMAARAYGDPGVLTRAFEHPDPNIKSIAGALVDSSGEWARMRDAATRGDIAAGHDVTGDVMQAVKSIMRARDEGRPLWEVMNQGDMFQSDTSQLAARLFFKDEAMRRPEGRANVAENLETYAREAQKNTVGDRLFADDVAPADVLKRAATKEHGAEIHDLFNREADPAVADKAMTDPKVQDAATADLQRMMEQGQNQIVVTKPDGSVERTVIDKELHEIDQSLAMAKEVEGCMNYSVAAE